MSERLESFFSGIERWTASAPRVLALWMAAGGVALLATIDYVTGSEISFSVFYLAPVGFVTWNAGAGWGVFFAVVCAATWGAVDVVAGAHYSSALIPVWNSFVRFGFFGITAALVAAMRSAHERERSLARTDSLTGVGNGRTFEEAVRREIARTGRTGRAFTLAYVDLDRFKEVNDMLGHGVGDELLRAIAKAISAEVRTIDVVARLGGDEFGVLLSETDEADAGAALDRVMRSVDDIVAAFTVGDVVGATIGAAVFDHPPANADAAITAADGLMYEGKRLGRGQVVMRRQTA